MTATKAKEWRQAREEGVEVILPYSGFTARIRPIDVGFFALHKGVPDILAGIINPMIDDNRFDTPVIPQTDDPEARKAWLTFLDELVCYTFVEPQVRPYEEEPLPLRDNEISIEDILYQDKIQLYKLLSRPARSLHRLRESQIKLMEALPTDTNGASPAVEDHGNQPMGISANGNVRPVDGDPVRFSR